MMRLWRRATAWLVLIGCTELVRATEPRVAVVVETEAADVASWQAVLTAELTRLAPNADLVERAELARAWTERERAALRADGERTASAPAVLAVDRFVHFRRVGEARWLVDLVDAVGGRLLGSFAVDAANLDEAPRLADAAGRLLSEPRPRAKQDGGTRVAVIEAANGDAQETVFELATHLRAALAESGLVVLDRALTPQVVEERHDANPGLRDAATPASVLGADFHVSVTDASVLVLRVRDGAIIEATERLKGTGLAKEAAALAARLVPKLSAGDEKRTFDYLPQVETEALIPYYRGLAAFDAGRLEDAVIEFTRAYHTNGRFYEAYEWSARAYEALGMPEIAKATRRFLATEFLENLAAATGRVSPADGVAFLGVDATEPLTVAANDVAVITASALASRGELGLRLPEHLARLRREYDWMQGGVGERGREKAPPMLTRWALGAKLERGERGEAVVRWVLRDTLGLREPEREELALGADPTVWRERLSVFLAAWPKLDASVGGAIAGKGVEFPAVETGSGDAKEIAARLLASDGLEAERHRLRLLRIAPEHPLCVSPRRGRNDRPLGTFLEFGRMAHVIARLPKGDPQRRLVETRLAMWACEPFSPLKTFGYGDTDGRAGLKRLVDENQRDGAGLIARYTRLFLNHDKLEPAAIAAACEALLADLASDVRLLEGARKEFEREVSGLARLARLASVPTEEDLKQLDAFNVPVDLPTFSWTAEGVPTAKDEMYKLVYQVFAGLAGDDVVREARAALALCALGPARRTYNKGLLERFPGSLVIARHVVEGLSGIENSKGISRETTLSWASRQQHVDQGVEYVVDAVERVFLTTADTGHLSTANYVGTHLLGVLGSPDLRELVPAARYEGIWRRLVGALEDARNRGVTPKWGNPNTYRLYELTNEAVDTFYADKLSNIEGWIADPSPIEASLRKREKAWSSAKSMAPLKSWWWLARRWETREAFSAQARATLLAGPLEHVLRLVPDTLTQDDAENLWDLGMFLFQGKRDADAERVFLAIVGARKAENTPRAVDEVVANAWYRLAQVRHHAGRVPEAVEAARRGLELAEGRLFGFFEHHIGYIHQEPTLSARFSRLLVELRHDPGQIELPERTGFVRVRTENADNPLATVYYRTPPVAAGAEKQSRRRVLVLFAVNNEDPLEWLSDGHEWARFADANDLVLVAPRFGVSERGNLAESRFAHPRYAQEWSGEALLTALDRMAERTPLDTEKLMVYGRGSGGGCASHFAAWRPERVAAVAIANGNWTLSRSMARGMAEPSRLREAAFWIGANSRDDYAYATIRPRYPFVREYAERLRHLGARVEWTDWPSDDHTPLPEQETAARAFLARALRGETASREPAPPYPGAVLTLNFPELGVMHEGLPAACEVSIPKNYDPSRPAPLFVWNGGGSGGHRVDGLRPMVDFDRFVVVALPYPNGQFPRRAAENGGPVVRHWEFQRVMLERVRELVPNLHPNLRIVAGTSSGGHYIAYGLDQRWPGFAETFTTFVVHEGGSSPLVNRLPVAKGRRMLVLYGDKSESIKWRLWFNRVVQSSGADATILAVPGAGHGLTDDGRRMIREWIDALVAEVERDR